MRIYKANEEPSRGVTRLDRAVLDEFPADAADYPDFDAIGEHDEEPALLRARVLEDAREEAARKVEEAYEEGMRRGMAAAQDAFDASVAQSAEALKATAGTMQAAREQFLESLEPQVVELSRMVAQRILEHEARIDDALLRTTVRRALAQLGARERLIVRVHPDDLRALHEHRVTLIEETPGVEELHIEAWDDIAPGGCVVEAEDLQIDARLASMLDNILEALRE